MVESPFSPAIPYDVKLVGADALGSLTAEFTFRPAQAETVSDGLTELEALHQDMAGEARYSSVVDDDFPVFVSVITGVEALGGNTVRATINTSRLRPMFADRIEDAESFFHTIGHFLADVAMPDESELPSLVKRWSAAPTDVTRLNFVEPLAAPHTPPADLKRAE